MRARRAALDESEHLHVVRLHGLVLGDGTAVDEDRHLVRREVEGREEVGVGAVRGDRNLVGLLTDDFDGDVHTSARSCGRFSVAVCGSLAPGSPLAARLGDERAESGQERDSRDGHADDRNLPREGDRGGTDERGYLSTVAVDDSEKPGAECDLSGRETGEREGDTERQDDGRDGQSDERGGEEDGDDDERQDRDETGQEAVEQPPVVSTSHARDGHPEPLHSGETDERGETGDQHWGEPSQSQERPEGTEEPTGRVERADDGSPFVGEAGVVDEVPGDPASLGEDDTVAEDLHVVGDGASEPDAPAAGVERSRERGVLGDDDPAAVGDGAAADVAREADGAAERLHVARDLAPDDDGHAVGSEVTLDGPGDDHGLAARDLAASDGLASASDDGGGCRDGERARTDDERDEEGSDERRGAGTAHGSSESSAGGEISRATTLGEFIRRPAPTTGMSEAESSSPGREIWIEKYRPQTLDDVYGQEDIVDRLESYIAQHDLPHLLFAGPAGIGKTTCATAIAREVYGDDWRGNFLELNASDERGIDVVRDRIKNFARASFGGHDYRIIFLDEADSLTSDAQSALRRTMEQFSDNTRFILSCNYSSKIIDPIQSRCAVFRFSPLSDDAVAGQIRKIANREGIEMTDEGLDALVYAADGDMRRAINSLQAAATTGDVVDEEAVYMITSTARPEEIESMVTAAIDGDFARARSTLDTLLTETGMAGGDIIDQLHRGAWDFGLSQRETVRLMERIGEADYRITEGANEQVQLEALLASLALDE